MNKNLYRAILVAVLITGQLSAWAQNVPAVAAVAPAGPYILEMATINHFDCSITDKRVSLNWSVEKNQTADQFIVEKSTDGRNFVMAALVFGTDKPGPEEYRFYEKATRKSTYRIKILHKDASVSWSEAMAAIPGK